MLCVFWLPGQEQQGEGNDACVLTVRVAFMKHGLNIQAVRGTFALPHLPSWFFVGFFFLSAQLTASLRLKTKQTVIT